MPTDRTLDHTSPLDHVPIETRVRLIGRDRDLSVDSRGGRFEFTGLEEGPYRLQVEVPPGYTGYGTARDVRLVDPRACAEVKSLFFPAGRIAGRIVGADGRPVEDVPVEITGAETKPHPDWGLPTASDSTDADGFFEVDTLPPGRYVVGLNLRDPPNHCNPYARTAYPGPELDPYVVELALGRAVDLGGWQIPPPLPVVRVEGIVLRADSTPVAGVYAGAWDETGDWSGGADPGDTIDPLKGENSAEGDPIGTRQEHHKLNALVQDYLKHWATTRY